MDTLDKEKDSLITPDDYELSDESPLLPRSPAVKRASERWLTVEPILFICSLSIGILVTVNPQYIKHRLSDARNVTSYVDDYSDNGTCNAGNKSDPDYILEQQIQADTSLWQMVITIAGYFPALFVAPLIGAWGDKVGRKATLAVTVIGFTIYIAIYLFVIFLELPLWVIAIGSFLSGMGGNYGLLLATCLAYVADITTKEKRMHRIVIVQVTFVLGIGISQILVGFLIKYIGFGASFFIALITLLLGLIYVFVPPFLIETVQSNASTSTSKALKQFDKSTFQATYDLFRVNTDRRRVKLIVLILTAFSIEVLGQSSLSVTVIYGLGPPFCWSSVEVGWYSAVVIILSAVGMAAGSRGLAMCLGDVWIIQVGNLFAVANGLLNAFSTTTLELFLVAVVTCIRAVDQPMFHLMLSKLVSAEEQGVMFAFESSVLNLASFMSPVLLNSVYSATVETQPNAVFIVMAVTRIVPIILVAILQILYRSSKDSKPAVTAMDKVNGPVLIESS